MAVQVKVKVTPKEYRLIKSSDRIDLRLELTTGDVVDIIKLITL